MGWGGACDGEGLVTGRGCEEQSQQEEEPGLCGLPGAICILCFRLWKAS